MLKIIPIICSAVNSQIYKIICVWHQFAKALAGIHSPKQETPQTPQPERPERPTLSQYDRQRLLNQSIKELRNSLHTAFWWSLVQSEVKERVGHIVDNLQILGPLYRDAFMAGYRFEYTRRAIEGRSIPKEPGALFGKSLPEESFRCGVEPSKLVLNLSSWTEPNDADVQACLTICNKVGELQKNGILPEVDPLAKSELIRQTTATPKSAVDPALVFEMIFGSKKEPPKNS